MARKKKINILDYDWLSILLFLTISVIGIILIYSVDYYQLPGKTGLATHYGKQSFWLFTGLISALSISLLDRKFIIQWASLPYLITLVLLAGLFIAGKEVSGARSWYSLGFFNFQPSELAKPAVALGLAKLLTDKNFHLNQFNGILKVALLIVLPVFLILLQPDLGTALVYIAFIAVLWREGLPTWIVLAGILISVLFIFALYFPFTHIATGIVLLVIILSVLIFLKIKKEKFSLITFVWFLGLTATGWVYLSQYTYQHLLKPHQQKRIDLILGKIKDDRGSGYHLKQSLIAISSGKLRGEGFLNGTQLRGKYIPEQHTDYIFTALAEQFGWIGSLIFIILYFLLIFRLFQLAERQKLRFSRVLAYSLASLLAIHFLLNIMMVTGLFPTIGIPIPFVSYGGTSMVVFTIFLFLVLKFDAHRVEEW